MRKLIAYLGLLIIAITLISCPVPDKAVPPEKEDSQDNGKPQETLKPGGKLKSLSCDIELYGQPDAVFVGYTDPDAKASYPQGRIVYSDKGDNIWIYAIIGHLDWLEYSEPDVYPSSFENVEVTASYENGFVGNDGKSKLCLVEQYPDEDGRWITWTPASGYDRSVRPALVSGDTYLVMRPVRIRKPLTMKSGSEPKYTLDEKGNIVSLSVIFEGNAGYTEIIRNKDYVGDKGQLSFKLYMKDGSDAILYTPGQIGNITGGLEKIEVRPRKGRKYNISFDIDVDLNP